MHGSKCATLVDGVPELQLKVVVIEDRIQYRCYECGEIVSATTS